MIEQDKINADWARTHAKNIMNSTATAQLTECLAKIAEAASNNQMSVHLRIAAEPIVATELKKRGFIVDLRDNQYDGASINIAW